MHRIYVPSISIKSIRRRECETARKSGNRYRCLSRPYASIRFRWKSWLLQARMFRVNVNRTTFRETEPTILQIGQEEIIHLNRFAPGKLFDSSVSLNFRASCKNRWWRNVNSRMLTIWKHVEGIRHIFVFVKWRSNRFWCVILGTFLRQVRIHNNVGQNASVLTYFQNKSKNGRLSGRFNDKWLTICKAPVYVRTEFLLIWNKMRNNCGCRDNFRHCHSVVSAK